MNVNDLRKQQIAGFYLDVPIMPSQRTPDDVRAEMNKIQGG